MEKVKNQNRARNIALALATALIVVGLIAYLTDSITFNNTFNMTTSDNAVNISGQELMLDTSTTDPADTTAWVDATDVKSGDLISKIPQVEQKTANTQAVWVRAKVEITQPLSVAEMATASTAKGQATLLDVTTNESTHGTNCIVGLGSGWTGPKEVTRDATTGKVTAYYYLTAGLDKGATTPVNLFTGVQIPSDWGNAMVGKTPTCNVIFQAVQKENVTQDTTSETPWGTATPSTFETLS